MSRCHLSPLDFRFYLIEELGRYLGLVFQFLMCREMQVISLQLIKINGKKIFLKKEDEVKWIHFISNVFFFVLVYTLLDPRNLIYKTSFLCVPWLIYSCMEVSPLESVHSPSSSLSSVLLQLMSIITF